MEDARSREEDARRLGAALERTAQDARERCVHACAYESAHVDCHHGGVVAELAEASLLYAARIGFAMTEAHEYLSAITHLLSLPPESFGLRISSPEILSL